ncbi:hypothetical protein J2W91_005415 [Paenibacillus amylolyticus]|uniref:Peptidase MA-like domain-containing protein n=1 Tax=Paenibacillus amylolyticus TaxID=1451 RepID=A0AAP5LRP4_PAEAM|nr:hypothetical protein [Paenibacillus amylolyticus]MDR6726890.1 hypothetical protein [Paenibacillus amylolyticus]
MKLFKNKSKIIGLIIVLFIVSSVAVSLKVYAKPVHAVLVNYSNMDHIKNNVYIESDVGSNVKNQLLELVQLSEDKVINVFGNKVSSPYVIAALSHRALDMYAENLTGQTYYYPWKNYIVVGPKGLTDNVLSHEFTHAELRERLHNKNKVPVWFDEGLATMVDGRFSSNEEAWKEHTNDGENPIDYKTLDSHDAFNNYGTAEAWMNYNLACYEVTRWYTIVGSSGLLQLIDVLNKGEEFDVQYRLIESETENQD